MNDSTPTHQPEASSLAVPEGYKLISGNAYGQRYCSLICPDGSVIENAYEQGAPKMFAFLSALATQPPAAPESFYVRFAKEWITASEDERQRISEWMTGWYGEPAAPVAAVGEAVPLTVVQYNAIPELCAIRPSLYESIVRAIERAHGILPAASMGAK